MGRQGVSETGIRHHSAGDQAQQSANETAGRTAGSGQHPSTGLATPDPALVLPLTMAATTAGNLNGIPSGFQWSPGIVANGASVRLLSHLLSSSGQISMQS
jgi:hypothetical protein